MDAEACRKSANALGKILDQALIRAAEEKAPADRSRMEDICTQAVRYAVYAELGGDDRNKPIGRSLYRYLLHEMANAASDYALAKNIDPGDFELQDLSEALAVVQQLRYAFVRDSSVASLDFWDSHSSPFDKIKADKVPYIDRLSLESVVDAYLELPYRSRTMDRFLVRVLVAVELYAFGDEMWNEKTFGLFPARSPLKQRHVLLAYLRGQIVNVFSSPASRPWHYGLVQMDGRARAAQRGFQEHAFPCSCFLAQSAPSRCLLLGTNKPTRASVSSNSFQR